MIQVTVDTVLAPTIGYPMRQSLSAKLSNVMYERMGLDILRFPIELADASRLGDVIHGLRYMNVKSIGITKPFKVQVIQYCDELDDFARKMGAVNHVHIIDGKLVGFSRDGEGFLYSLQRTGCKISESVFFCFGAGGAGRAICGALANEGAKKIYITDLIGKYAEELAENINHAFAPVAEAVDFSDVARVQKLAHEADVVMNVTGLGMAPHLSETPLDRSVFREGQIAFDAVYNPAETRFLREAKESGCQILSGKGMLIRLQMLGAERRSGRKVTNYEEWEQVFDSLLAEEQAKQEGAGVR
ncbi:shikimate dehydrogenase family protein [Hominifimenecus sp. rT4P-3]|uniref:shikimate dehydrogenase family protein n=1 Tax=Hominifimenecus sp. rT4P-3 TaxID=3242979 RepID=UPI003DA49B18